MKATAKDKNFRGGTSLSTSPVGIFSPQVMFHMTYTSCIW